MKRKPAFNPDYEPSIFDGLARMLPLAVACAVDTASGASELGERTQTEIAGLPGAAVVEAAISIYQGDEFDDLVPGPTSPEARWAAAEIAGRLTELTETVSEGDRGRLTWLAQAWQVVAADPAAPASVATAAQLIDAAATQFVLRAPSGLRDMTHRAATRLCSAWALLSAGMEPVCHRGRETNDLIRLAHDYLATLNDIDLRIEESQRLADNSKPKDAAGPPDGIFVIDKVGGLSTTSAGRDAVKAFDAIAGKRIERIRTPSLAPVRAALCGEFPHAERVIDALLLDLAASEFVRLRPTLLVSAIGGRNHV